MKNKKIEVSIITVNYKVEKELLACIDSIVKSKARLNYEIIVVDNDERKIGKQLKRKFPQVVYIESPGNIGYGAANNLGAKHAKGEFLFFLNPDTEVYPETLDKLVDFLRKRKGVGIVAPLLYDFSDKPYVGQGSQELGVSQGVVALSFLNKLFPNNPISKKYRLGDWDRKKEKEVGVVAGTAFVIRKEIFQKILGFDERFFLFFEEFDLCKRVKSLGYKIFITPEAKVKHIWGASTKKSHLNLQKVFNQSRFYYFKKHYGLIGAIIVNVFASLSAAHGFLFIALSLSLFLNFQRLSTLMSFIGDQGWFYLSARDLILTGDIPLVGITSSHTWLHQGPLWTYILAGALYLSNFNPLSGAYITSFLGSITTFLVYLTSSYIFSKKIGIISAFLYATSPLIIMNNRLAYHTSIIPLCTALYILFLFKWIRGNATYFPFIILTLGALYNLELATAYLWFVTAGIFTYGLWQKKKWAAGILRKSTLFLSLAFFILPMLPILIYDSSHNFVQTVGFLLWIFYKFFIFLINSGHTWGDNVNALGTFFYNNINRLVFLPDGGVALFLFFSSLLYFTYLSWKSYAARIFGLVTAISIAALFISGSSSDAYLPVLFVPLVIILACLLSKLAAKKFLYLGYIVIIILIIANSYLFVRNGFSYTQRQGEVDFVDKVDAARRIVSLANGEKYNMIGEGWLAEFESYIMNYEYLAWWLGNGPSKEKANLLISIEEEPKRIVVEKKMEE